MQVLYKMLDTIVGERSSASDKSYCSTQVYNQMNLKKRGTHPILKLQLL
jgi:hypothetical protein